MAAQATTFVFVVLAAILVARAHAAAVSGSVYCNGPRTECTYTIGIHRDSLAWGWFDNTVNSTGWATFTGVANPTQPLISTSYALGFLEGTMTAGLIWPMFLNFKADTFVFSADTQTAVESFFTSNTAWVNDQVHGNPGSLYWQRVGSMYDQLSGLAAGYNGAALPVQRITGNEFAMMSGMADFSDIALAVNRSLRPHLTMPPEEAMRHQRRYGHCSSIVRFTPALDELFAAQNTWTTYTQMLRIFKFYVYADTTMALSSYPGVLSSTDDFFQMSTGLVVMETTLDVYNGSVYDAIVPQSVFSWARVMVSNRLAKTGPAWVGYVSQYNSGTYNNQWIVVNYNLFTPGAILPANTVVIVEQLPGIISSMDVTPYVAIGAFPSFNRAFIPTTIQRSGAADYIAAHGSYFSYQGSPRAQIYRRDAYSIVNISTLQAFMRYNHWQTDPLAGKDATNGVAARYDLSPEPEAGGAIDAKCTSRALMRDMKVLAVSGPTWDSQPVFEWTAQWQQVAHFGQPTRFQFDWVEMDSAA